MQSQSHSPRASNVSSVVNKSDSFSSAFAWRKEDDAIVFSRHKDLPDKLHNAESTTKSQSSHNAMKEQDKAPMSIETYLPYTAESLHNRFERQKQRKEPRSNDSTQWQRGQELKPQLERETSDATTKSDSFEQWKRGEALDGVVSGAAATGANETLQRRKQRMETRKLERAESTDTSKSQKSQCSKTSEPEQKVDQTKSTAEADSPKKQCSKTSEPKGEQAESTTSSAMKSQPKQKTSQQKQKKERLQLTAASKMEKSQQNSPEPDRKVSEATLTGKSASGKKRNKKKRRKKSKKEQKRATVSVASNSKVTQQEQEKPNIPVKSDPGKLSNAWDKPMTLFKADSNGTDATPKEAAEQSEKEQEPLMKEQAASATEQNSSKKKEQSLGNKGTNNKSALTTSSKRGGDSSNVRAIRPSDRNTHNTTPRDVTTLPTDAYPRVTPLPIQTYPRGLYDNPGDWFISPHHVIALDAEFVGAGMDGKRSILARLSLVDWNGTVLVDCFVAPTEHITDYRTFVSGIHPHHLVSPQAMDFQACRALVASWLKAKIVLVGHGLSNDLAALNLTHPWFHLRDSATYLPFMKPCCGGGKCPKRLKDLAREQLGLSIQQDGSPHCSVVDARTSMELYKRNQVQWDLYIRAQRINALANRRALP